MYHRQAGQHVVEQFVGAHAELVQRAVMPADIRNVGQRQQGGYGLLFHRVQEQDVLKAQ
ncbi:hypothetical protein D3C72_2041020 [compost metagenome]